jgi:ferric-dicitrate binding protein FerR (iron transport regulator)
MAASKSSVNVSAAAAAARSNPYVQRLIDDAELRDNVRVAFESARQAYNRISSGKAPAKALMEDKKLHKELRHSAEALREATTALRAGPKRKKRRGGIGRKLLVLAAGAGLAVAVSSDLRSKILDALFGKEEEFEYTSTTAPPAPAPSAAETVTN